jgi:outer membrane biosynthesis protein TonB
MEPIKINVNVQVGVTEELYSLLRNLLPGAKPVAAPEPAVQQRESKTDEAPQPAEVINQEPTPEPKNEEAAPAKEEADKEYTEVDVRAAMERTRKRIEGEDYKENTSSEKYKKYHRQLTAEFKNIAAFLGSEKPSALPTSELRRNFCNQCDELILEDGKITRKVPF